MVKAATRPEKESYVLVDFHHGTDALTVEKYTDFTSNFEGYLSTPAMEVTLPENTGSLESKEIRIVLPQDIFSTRASNGLPHSPIFVKVQEITFGLAPGDIGSLLTVFHGRVMKTIRNFQGSSGVVAFFADPIKARLDIKMGLLCNPHCVWTLFGRGCSIGVPGGPDIANFMRNVEITARDGKHVTITNPIITSDAGADQFYWRRGWVRKDGLTIGIRDWDLTDPTVFVLDRAVPADWVLAGFSSIDIVPGCDKTVETCRARYNNEANFAGVGYAIPAHQPNLEVGG